MRTPEHMNQMRANADFMQQEHKLYEARQQLQQHDCKTKALQTRIDEMFASLNRVPESFRTMSEYLEAGGQLVRLQEELEDMHRQRGQLLSSVTFETNLWNDKRLVLADVMTVAQ